jgi:hypothetical protein
MIAGEKSTKNASRPDEGFEETPMLGPANLNFNKLNCYHRLDLSWKFQLHFFLFSLIWKVSFSKRSVWDKICGISRKILISSV